MKVFAPIKNTKLEKGLLSLLFFLSDRSGKLRVRKTSTEIMSLVNL